MALLRDKESRTALRADLYERFKNEGVALSETVRTLRRVLAKDQATFSKEVGVSLSTLRKIEQQGGGVSLATAQKILAKFGLELVVRLRRPKA